MSFVKVGEHAGNLARSLFRAPVNAGFSGYTIPNRITLYGVPNLITPGDIRRAIGDKVKEGIASVQIDYHGFRPSGKAIITMKKIELLGNAVKCLKSLHIAGIPVQAVPQYGPDPSQRVLQQEGITGNGPSGNYPNVERSVVLWGLPGKTSVEEVTIALLGFKTEQKDGKAVVVKLAKPEQFTIFSRFVVTMASISEARRLVRAWHMTPWKPNSPDLIAAQILY